MNIRNIFCIGRNYADHAKELGNTVPKSPIFFSKPTHSLTFANRQEVSLPSDKGEIHHELEIVLYIGKKVKDGSQVDDVVTKMSLGIDFTLRNLQTKLKNHGYPWLRAKGFRNSAVLTNFWDFPGTQSCQLNDFSLVKNGETVQSGNIQEMIFDFQTIINHLHNEFGLDEGDIIFTGTPEGVGPVSNQDLLIMFWGEQEKGRFVITI
ncbi:fumarylacetoacetate hydrolase family protein [Bacillus kwashiorkori]|uniref:fumarylacetoacetate hydrolase family protein n=1 Tax=Bacillus kwashiorkori TaxID=1522318 RepID=UPI000B2B1E90|nr:fumarylacetoacetate hydrolase family protein [Bacillus kwashiorkori]